MRFYELQAGVISLDGQDIRDVTQRSLRSAVSLFVFDEHPRIYCLSEPQRLAS